jgi:ABC-type Fe3+-hydroxamate transport system substrate-binding protein
MVEVIDQTGVRLVMNEPAQRIVSLVPSITELLFDLRLDKEVKGITRFCNQPVHWKKIKTIVGGTKKIKHDLIESLQPDLILANKEENTRNDVLKLREKFQVYTSDVKNLDDAAELIAHTGILTCRANESDTLIRTIQEKFALLKQALSQKPAIKALYFIWKNPYMIAGADTFIHHIMEAAGFRNTFRHQLRYPEISEKQIRNSDAEVILLSSEPFPFTEKHVTEIKKIIPAAQCILVDGTYFSWYGSRLKHAPDYLDQLRMSIDTMRNFEPQS